MKKLVKESNVNNNEVKTFRSCLYEPVSENNIDMIFFVRAFMYLGLFFALMFVITIICTIFQS